MYSSLLPTRQILTDYRSQNLQTKQRKLTLMQAESYLRALRQK